MEYFTKPRKVKAIQFKRLAPPLPHPEIGFAGFNLQEVRDFCVKEKTKARNYVYLNGGGNYQSPRKKARIIYY